MVLLGTDETLGVFDDEMEVAAFLAFEKLDRNRVEVLADRSPMATFDGVTPAPAGLRDLSSVHSNRRPGVSSPSPVPVSPGTSPGRAGLLGIPAR